MAVELRRRRTPGRVSTAYQLVATAARVGAMDDALRTLLSPTVECLRWGTKELLLMPIPPDSHAWHQNTEAFHIENCGRTTNFQKGLGSCWWLRGDCGWALQVGLTAQGGKVVGATGIALQ